jgi:hypothetical protein
MQRIVMVLMLGALLAGCSSAHLALMTSGPPVELLRTLDGTELVMGACDVTLSSTCERITKTTEPTDEEAWQYVAKIKIQNGYGIPYGEASVPVYVLGPVENCQRMAHRAQKLPEDRGARCDGPFYFKRG